MSAVGIAIKLSIKGAGAAGEAGCRSLGTSEKFAEEAKSAFEVVNGGIQDGIAVQYSDDSSGLTKTEQVAVSTLVETLGTAGLIFLTGATGGGALLIAGGVLILVAANETWLNEKYAALKAKSFEGLGNLLDLANLSGSPIPVNNGLLTSAPPNSTDTRRCHPPIDPTKPNEFFGSKSYRPPPTDPFILDLDGDGVETINVTSGILFDHNADGVLTGTGWVKSDDALLVRDLNGNGTIDSGRELFGDQTLLTNGQLAANGFAALRDLDANADGIIDASDAAFDQLKVWRDLNQDGISQADELQTLADAGIASINLTATTKNQWSNGNTITSTGSYTKTDGSTGTTADVNLAINTATTQFTDDIEVPETLLDLPDMSGSGQVRDLQQAATLSPALADLLTQYSGATTRDSQLALLDQMLLAWADTSGMAKSLDARAAGSYKVEYLNFGSISRSSHLQQNTATTAVTTSLTNAGFADGYDCVRERRVA